MRFKILHGSHYEGGRLYREGETVNSGYNLLAFNSRGSIKFEEVSSGVPISRTNLEELTRAELESLAEKERIDVTGLESREELLEVLRAILG